MKSVNFLPLVGKNYEIKGFNDIKILVLGESHYCDDDCELYGVKSNNDRSKFTITVMNRFFDYKKGKGEHEYWMNTFTKFTNGLLEDKVDNQKLLEFWDSVIFYNYVQSTTSGPRESPTNEQFIESENAFFEILESYKPDLIIVWGERLWNNLPNNSCIGNENILDNANGQFKYYKVGNKNIPAYRSYHPSTRYFTFEYAKYINEAINIVRNNKTSKNTQ